MNSFGSFNAKATIRRKGAGMGKSSLSKYAELEAEIDRREAEKEHKRLLEEAAAKRAA